MKILTHGICLLIFCLPLYLVRFNVFGIPTTVLEVIIYGLFVIWLVQRGFKGMRKDLKGFKGVILPIALIIIGVSLATIFSSDLRTSAGIWKAWFIDPLLLFIVIISSIKSLNQIKKVLYSLFLSGVVVSIISLVYLIQDKFDPSGRLQAFYNSPNYLAMYLAPALIISFWILSSEAVYFLKPVRRPSEAPHSSSSASLSRFARTMPASACGKFQKVYRFAFIPLFTICLLLSIIFSQSFGAWLGIIVAIGFGLILYFYESKNKKMVWIILILVLAAVLFLGNVKLFVSISGDSSIMARLLIWQKAWQVFQTKPVLGIGPGTLNNYFPSYPQWGVPQPHNVYLAFLVQTGIIGFIGFLWLLVWFFKIGIKNLKYKIKPKALGRARLLGNWELRIGNLILISIMIYILVHGLVDTTYWKNDLSIIFWLIVGLMAVLQNRNFRE